jgi:hypothetical protein
MPDVTRPETSRVELDTERRGLIACLFKEQKGDASGIAAEKVELCPVSAEVDAERKGMPREDLTS